MNGTQFSLTNTRNTTIYGYDWAVKEPKAVVCLVHGFGEHIRRYDHVAKIFNQNKLAIIGIDRAGEGQSGNNKGGYISNINDHLDEVQMTVDEASKRYPNLPIILYGHSQGGNLGLNYILRRKPKNISLALATSPWIELTNNPSALLVGAARLIYRVLPGFNKLPQVSTSDISRDPEVVKKYTQDKFVRGKMNAKIAVNMIDAAQFLNTYSDEMPIPTLVIHGTADNICSVEASKNFAARNQKNVTFKLWEGLYHETHNEPEKEEVIQYNLDWILKQLQLL